MFHKQWLPEFVQHLYWHKKEQFLLTQDTYLTWILFAVEEGSFDFRILQHMGAAEKGDIVICPPQTAFHRHITQPLSFHAISFQLPDSSSHTIFNQSLKKQQYKLHMSPSLRLSENFQQLRDDPALPRLPVHQLSWKQHYFMDLWLMILNEHSHHFGSAPVHVMDDDMHAIALFLEEHAQQSIELKRIAADYGMTSVQLIRRFKAVFHVNPLQYLTALRIKKVCSLLTETDWKLDTIAQQCGYENGFYLSRLFSKHMGISPSAYRKQNLF